MKIIFLHGENWWLVICWNMYSNLFVNSSYEIIKEPSRPPSTRGFVASSEECNKYDVIAAP